MAVEDQRLAARELVRVPQEVYAAVEEGVDQSALRPVSPARRRRELSHLGGAHGEHPDRPVGPPGRHPRVLVVTVASRFGDVDADDLSRVQRPSRPDAPAQYLAVPDLEGRLAPPQVVADHLRPRQGQEERVAAAAPDEGEDGRREGRRGGRAGRRGEGEGVGALVPEVGRVHGRGGVTSFA